jgi:ribosomal protein L44E
VTSREDVAAATDRALERHRKRVAAEEGPKPRRSADEKPTKDQAWAAYCASCADDERAPVREEFERWWTGAT